MVDKESRSNHVDTEWMLQTIFLNLALEYLWFKPEIYLFATNINTQFGKYEAFRKDPGAMYVVIRRAICSELAVYCRDVFLVNNFFISKFVRLIFVGTIIQKKFLGYISKWCNPFIFCVLAGQMPRYIVTRVDFFVVVVCFKYGGCKS